MKRITAVVLLLVISFSALATAVCALFVYRDGSLETETDISASNTLFNVSDINNYYRVYFFASPYYATGADLDGVEEDDPLTIAKSPSNPYNSTNDYMMIGPNFKNDPVNIKFANAVFPSGDAHYINCKGRTDIPLSTDGALIPFEERDFTGYIRENRELRIEQTSTYVSLTVEGNLTAEQLDGIVAATEFKDKFGFGPEFIGWTYDKAATKQRTVYTVDGKAERFITSSDLSVCDSKGWGKRQTPYQYGNYGCQGVIEQVTPTTSFKAIDKTGDDGSAVDDRIIYLYPVFVSKNYEKSTSVDENKSTSLIKFRVNPYVDSTDPNENYTVKQYYEIDYSTTPQRYTVCLFQNKLNDENNNINYYTDNIFFGGAETGDKYQLDICPALGTAWSSQWFSLLSQSEFDALGLEAGYYNIDLTFVPVGSSYSGTTEFIGKVNEIKDIYTTKNQYIKILTSSDENKEPLTGVVGFDCGNGNVFRAYYVLGIQKVEEYHLVGDRLSGKIDTYDGQGYRSLNTTTQLSSETMFITENVFAVAGSKISVLTEYADGKSGNTLPYRITPMDATLLSQINANVSYSGMSFLNIGENSTDNCDVFISDNTVNVNKSDNYTFIYRISYSNGYTSEISIAYTTTDSKYSFIVLKSEPTQDFYTANDELNTVTLARCDKDEGSMLGLDTALYSINAVDDPKSNYTVGDLFNSNPGKLLYDSATGTVIPKEVFTNSEFCLNRNYVLYFK